MGKFKIKEGLIVDGDVIVSGFTQGSILYISGQTITEDNNNLFFNSTTKGVGLRTNNLIEIPLNYPTNITIDYDTRIGTTYQSMGYLTQEITLGIGDSIWLGIASGLDPDAGTFDSYIGIYDVTSANIEDLIATDVANNEYNSIIDAIDTDDEGAGVTWSDSGEYVNTTGNIQKIHVLYQTYDGMFDEYDYIIGEDMYMYLSLTTDPTTISPSVTPKTYSAASYGDIVYDVVISGNSYIIGDVNIVGDVNIPIGNSYKFGDINIITLPDQIEVEGSLIYGTGGANLVNGGRFNTFVGMGAGYSGTTGSRNTAIGYNALCSNTIGYFNNAIGENALLSNTCGCYNNALGNNALCLNTIGVNNSALGNSALRSNTCGSNNTTNGYQSMLENITGNNNTANGYRSLCNNRTGNGNSANGYLSLAENCTGDNNTANGYQSMYHNTSGNCNTAIGNGAMFENIIGNDNTAIGRSALGANTIGNCNVGVGYQSGIWIANGVTGNYSGNTSVFLGGDTRANADSQTNQIVIGYGAIGAGSNTVVLGNTGITKTYLRGDTHTNNIVALRGDIGDAVCNTFIGVGAGYTMCGTHNTIIGYAALYKNTSGYYNVAVGHQSLYNNTTGAENVANGNQSLYLNVCGKENTAIGNRSLQNNSCGCENTANGVESLLLNLTGCYNTAIGPQTLYGNTNGCYNIGIGYQAGKSIVAGGDNGTGCNNIFLGKDTRAKLNGDTNEIVIGHETVGHGSNTTTIGNTNTTETYISGDVYVAGAITHGELSADPSDPSEGKTVMWTSDGIGTGDDGDVMMKITAGGVTKIVTIVDFSAA